MKIIVITNCTARKARPASPSLRARTLPKGTAIELAREWNKRLQDTKKRLPAGDLYQGRGYLEATKAARFAGTPLHIISAGVGLITELDAIPPYSLTISVEHVDSIATRLANKEVFHPGQWWTALQSARIGGRGLAEMVEKSQENLYVLALSPVYLGLIVDELLGLKAHDLARFRLIGPRREEEVPEGLRHIYMPYDGRIDGERSPIKGTESDFPQRAGWHFVELLSKHPSDDSPEKHRNAVQKAIATWPYRKVVLRKRLPESELRTVIGQVLHEKNGYWTLALRRLRDDLKIACEEKRFRAICNEILEGKK